MKLDPKIPEGPIEKKWDDHRFKMKLVNPANKRKFNIIVVGAGLAGSSASASLAELGYNVLCFCYQDSPRRAHSIAAQGGINAAKNYPNDGDSIYRLFYDTVKGGDYRAREANVYRLFDLENDPYELNNLADSTRPEHREALIQLRAALDTWTTETGDLGRWLEPADIVRPFEKEMHEWFGTPDWFSGSGPKP